LERGAKKREHQIGAMDEEKLGSNKSRHVKLTPHRNVRKWAGTLFIESHKRGWDIWGAGGRAPTPRPEERTENEVQVPLKTSFPARQRGNK